MMQIFKIVIPVIFSGILALANADVDNNNLFSKNVASCNDWILSKGQNNKLLKPFSWITSRTMSVTLFPLSTAIDMAFLCGKQTQQIPHIVLCQDFSHINEFRKNNESLKSCSLGLISCPLGIICPDIITQHFLPDEYETYQIEPYGKLYCTKAHMVSPKSTEEIQNIIKEAKASGKSISVVGKFMCQGKQAISNKDWNVVINTSQLNKITIDPTQKIAKIGSGASWSDLQREANKHGLAVRVMQASNIFSIGGSISANCHGWDFRTGCLRNTIISLTIIDGNALVKEITADDPLFDYIVGGYGIFGVIVEVTLRLCDNLELMEWGVEISPRDYLDYFNNSVLSNDEIDMHIYRLSLNPKCFFQTGIAVNYQRISNDPVIAELIDEPSYGIRGDRIKLHSVRRSELMRKLAWRLEKKYALETKIASRNEIMRPPINPVFNTSRIDSEWLQEYFVKGEDLADFLLFLGNALKENEVALLNASVRFVRHDPKSK